MLSVNHSMEELGSYPQRTSQINPNMSSTNILQLNHPKAWRTPKLPFQQVTPPLSNSPTPVTDKQTLFSVGPYLHPSHASSVVSLDLVAELGPVALAPAPFWKAHVPRVDMLVFSLCVLWYGFSIVLSNSTKAILQQFRYPVTLTQFQFVLNAVLCTALFAGLAAYPALTRHFPAGSIPNLHALDHLVRRFLTPTAFVVSTTLPMGVFQFLGHISSHKATLVIPVSLVHTIKALLPITTVVIYRAVYRTSFRAVTYLTLVPLMLGIMLTCYKPRSAVADAEHYVLGLVYAFVLMVIFVLQNIFAKKRLTPADKTTALPSHRHEEKKVDKLTILLFCLAIGFLFTLPVYVISEFSNRHFSLAQVTPRIALLVALNGVSHFMQSLLAFLLLGTISPINYSIANIMKRIAVILFAFMWESSFSFSGTQSYGIVLTVAGLYCYDRWGIARTK